MMRRPAATAAAAEFDERTLIAVFIFNLTISERVCLLKLLYSAKSVPRLLQKRRRGEGKRDESETKEKRGMWREQEKITEGKK